MPAAEASELLARFAAGSGRAEICTAEGRALLRGAIRAYGAEMRANGVVWPALPQAGVEAVHSVDVSVLVAFAAGFVDASDLSAPARGFASHLALAQWPEIRGMRNAAQIACAEVAALQQATAQVVIETERLRQLAQHDAGERLRRQHDRVERANAAMQQLAAAVQARMNAANAA